MDARRRLEEHERSFWVVQGEPAECFYRSTLKGKGKGETTLFDEGNTWQ